MPLSPDETDLIARASAAPMLAQVRQWAAINSGTRNLAGLETMAGRLADAFAVLPGAVTLVEPAAVDAMLPDGRVEPIDHGRHLTVSVRPEAPVRLLLTGHMDTVYPANHAFQTLTDRDANTLNGPGVADMKSGIALMLAALTAIEASPWGPRIGYDVLINSDEETGSFSSAALIASLARGKAAALTYEPALPDGTLAGARRGSGNFSIRVEGISAHAGRNPRDGRNAVVAAADLALRLAAAGDDGLSVNPARIEGGGPNNVVPDLAILRVNFRASGPDEVAAAQAAIEDAVAAVTAAHGVTITVHGGFNRPAKPIDVGAARLFETVRAAGTDLGLAIAWKETGGVCDGNNIAACGVPVVDTMGARGGAIHSPDEYLLIDSLAERAALSALTIARIAERGAV